MEGDKKTKPKKFRELNDDERRKLIDGAKKKYCFLHAGTLMESWSLLSAIPNAKYTRSCQNFDISSRPWTKSRKLILKSRRKLRNLTSASHSKACFCFLKTNC